MKKARSLKETQATTLFELLEKPLIELVKIGDKEI